MPPLIRFICLMVLMLYIPFNNFSVMLGRVSQGRTTAKQRIKCFAQGHGKARVKHSTNEPLRPSIGYVHVIVL